MIIVQNQEGDIMLNASDTERSEMQYKTSGNLNTRSNLHALFSTNKYGWTRWLFDQYDFHEGDRILELGCGMGSLWTANMYRVKDSYDITLTDFSEGMVEEAGKNIHKSNFKFQRADVQDIPFEDGSFDAVIANHMLYHVPDRDRALSEIRRVLKIGGRFYASTMGITNLFELAKFVNEFDSSIGYPRTEDIIKFNLENGTAQILKHFTDVAIKRYEDSLVVTEVKPLVDYVLSLKGYGNIEKVLQEQKLAEFTSYIQSIIDEKGSIFISKDAGTFIAY